MTETITLKISMMELQTILVKHYKKEFNDETVRAHYRAVEIDRKNNEVKIFLTRKTQLDIFKGEITYELTDDEILCVLNQELTKSGYYTKKLNYFVFDDCVEKIEFDITKEKNKQKSIGGIKWNFKN